MPSSPEPEPEAPRVFTKRDRAALVRFLKSTGLWPLRLPELEPRRKPPTRSSRARQPWEPKAPRDR